MNDDNEFTASPRANLLDGSTAKCDIYRRYSRWSCNDLMMGTGNMAGKVKENKLPNLKFRLFNRVDHTPTWENDWNVCQGDMFYGMGTAIYSRMQAPQFK